MIELKLKLIFLPWHHLGPNREDIYGERGFPPLGIATLTAFLRKHGIDVEQDDLEIKVIAHNEKSDNQEGSINLHYFCDEERIDKLIEGGEETLEREGEKILKLTKCGGFDAIGLSLHSTDNVSVIGVALTISKLLKEKYGTTIITGDIMDRLALKKLLSSRFVDCSLASSHIASLAEVNLLKFCEMFEKVGDLQQIPGSIHLQNDGLKYTRAYETYTKEEKSIFTVPEFDGLPMDLYKYIVSSEIYGNTYTSKILIIPYIFIYGCPNSCAFCTYSKFPLTSLKPPEEVAEDLEFLSKKYNSRYFFFMNTEINPTKDYALSVADALIDKDLDIFWTDCAAFKNMDVELIEKLRQAGAARLVWGMENASPRLLEYINKDIMLDHAKACLEKSSVLGVWNQVLFICGFPYEREIDIDLTIDFIEKNRKFIHETTLNKFFIDGLFDARPEEFNIRVGDQTKSYRNWTTKPFDEVNGLPWRERSKLTLKFYDRLWDALNKLRIHGTMPTQIVFHLARLERDLGVKIENKDVFNFSKAGLSYKYFVN